MLVQIYANLTEKFTFETRLLRKGVVGGEWSVEGATLALKTQNDK